MNDFSLTSWDSYMITGTLVSMVFAVFIFLYHEFRIFQIKDFKEKYDYVNLNEIRFFWYTIMALIAAAFFYTNTIASGKIQEMDGTRWFFVRLFITVSFAVVAYFIFYSMVRIYYPRNVERRLQKLRHTPRISPQGNPMRRLSEDEEDVHLEASQQAEEASEIHSVDYDVWIDEKTGFKKIEKYSAYQHALECPECGYVTFRLISEEVEKAPTQTDTGLLLKHYRCNYCRHREGKEVVIARLADNQ